tara:strand:- start:679 stop:858 length:180 start_codon:yes stop_codon:yes gene_type:complete
MKKAPKNKLQLIDDILNANENSQIKISVADFKQLFSLAQLNRGWTKPQLEEIKARLKDG